MMVGNNNAGIFQQLHKNWYWYLLLGIGLVVLGSLAMIFSYTSTIFSVLYLGGFLAVVGVVEIFQAFNMRTTSKLFLHLLLGVLYLLAGGFMFINPALNAVTLTLLLAIFFVVSGIMRVIFALMYAVPHRGWLILNGVLAVILGALIWQQWPLSGLWAIGLFVGIDTIFTGWSWIVLAIAARRLK